MKKYLFGIEKGRRLASKTNSGKNSKDIGYEELEIKLDEIEEKKKLMETSKKEELILKCLIKGYFMNIAKYSSDNFFITLVIFIY